MRKSVLRILLCFMFVFVPFSLPAQEDGGESRMVVITNVQAIPALYEKYRHDLEEFRQEMEIVANRGLPSHIHLMPEDQLIRFICAGASCKAEEQKLLRECTEGGCRVLAERVPADYFITSELDQGSDGVLYLRINLWNSEGIALDRLDLQEKVISLVHHKLQETFPRLIQRLVSDAGGGTIEVTRFATIVIPEIEPRGTMVFLDGKFKTSSPEGGGVFSFPVPIDRELELRFKKGGYKDRVIRVPPLRDGETKKLAPLTLGRSHETSEREGILNIVSDPPGAKILIDGSDTGKRTPADFSLLPRKYEIALQKKPLYVTKVIEVDLRMKHKIDLTPDIATLTKRSCRLRIDSDPSSAEIVIQGKSFQDRGVTPYSRDEFPIGTFHITLSKTEVENGISLSYHPFETTLQTEVAQTYEKRYTLKPAFGYLEIQSDDVGARISIDGRSTGTLSAKRVLIPLNRGIHRIIVEREWYLPFEERVQIEEGETRSLFVHLTPNYAEIALRFTPVGGTVYVDGERTAEFSADREEVQRIEPGYHMLLLIPDDSTYREETREVHLTPMQREEIEVTFSKKMGTLYLRSEPLMADYFVDGEHRGTTADRIDLSVGPHRIEFRKGEGYEPEKRWVTIEEGKETSIMVQLREVSSVYRRKTWLGWGSLVLGVAASGGGAFMYWKANQDLSESKDLLMAYQAQDVPDQISHFFDDAEAMRNQSNRERIIAYSLFGTAGITMIYSLSQFFSRPDRLGLEGGETPRVRFAVQPDPNNGGKLWLQVGF
ncbi:MAG: PEGA domain-containing protein [Deltaproteobacteria bacterium]|nr:MAG: PEGA domain-containing protein [Deltaproteobacteria bacterium]